MNQRRRVLLRHVHDQQASFRLRAQAITPSRPTHTCQLRSADQCNRVSLGVQLMAQNGVQTFGVIQVPVVPGTNYASTASYLAALPQLKQNLPGLNRKADVVVPLSNDPVVHQALSQQLTTLATARYKGEGIGFVGFSQFTTPAQAIANANSLDNQRMIAIGNAAAGILVTNPTTGVAIEYLVDGAFHGSSYGWFELQPGKRCRNDSDPSELDRLQPLAHHLRRCDDGLHGSQRFDSAA